VVVDDAVVQRRNPSLPDPVLPLRDVVVYPHMVIPLFVGRDKSIQALDSAMADDKKILLVAQKSAEVDDPRWMTSIASGPCPPSCSC
jgi:ATP-dependent Lon protease